MGDKPAALIVAHGSRRAQAGDVLETMAAHVRQRLDTTRVDIAYLENGEPDVASAIENCFFEGVRRLVVIPLFLLPGVHVKVDLPRVIEAARQAFPNLQILQADFLGAHPALGGVVCELFLDCVKSGHGFDPRDD
jgi:sirohydrochlorin ferrochelatase